MIKKLSLSILCTSLLVTTVFAKELGLYDHYYLAPNPQKAITNPEGSQVIKVDREHGYYVDGRGQVPEYSRIPPPKKIKFRKILIRHEQLFLLTDTMISISSV